MKFIKNFLFRNPFTASFLAGHALNILIFVFMKISFISGAVFFIFVILNIVIAVLYTIMGVCINGKYPDAEMLIGVAIYLPLLIAITLMLAWQSVFGDLLCAAMLIYLLKTRKNHLPNSFT